MAAAAYAETLALDPGSAVQHAKAAILNLLVEERVSARADSFHLKLVERRIGRLPVTKDEAGLEEDGTVPQPFWYLYQCAEKGEADWAANVAAGMVCIGDGRWTKPVDGKLFDMDGEKVFPAEKPTSIDTDWVTGKFAFVAPMASNRWEAAVHGARFSRAGLPGMDAVEEAPLPEPAPAEVAPTTAKRAPSVKTGRAPTDAEILAKADEMKSRGLDGRKIAEQMKEEPGFANAGTVYVRELIKGRWRPGRGTAEPAL